MRPIHQKALADIAWADLEALVSGAVAEGPNLEFKRTLADPNGGDDPWIKGQDRIGRHARDELAREIVAFANAYGGLLLLGLDEAAGGIAKKTMPLPRCAGLAERLLRAIGDIVDPPMPGFDIRAIPSPAGDGTGVVALRVSGSSAAPHGYGEPPQAYVRRGTSATPMTMRDLQAVFWDARTRRERVERIREKARERLEASMVDVPQVPVEYDTHLPGGEQRIVRHDTARGVFLRVTAIPQHPLEFDPLPISAGSRPSMGELGLSVAPALNGVAPEGWLPMAHGLTLIQHDPARWEIRDDGTIGVHGFQLTAFGNNTFNVHYPGSFAALCAQVMVMGDRLRRRKGRPDIPIEIDFELRHKGDAGSFPGRTSHWDSLRAPQSVISVGPFLFAARDTADEVLTRLEREIWAGFGRRNYEPIDVDFDAYFSSSDGVLRR